MLKKTVFMVYMVWYIEMDIVRWWMVRMFGIWLYGKDVIYMIQQEGLCSDGFMASDSKSFMKMLARTGARRILWGTF